MPKPAPNLIYGLTFTDEDLAANEQGHLTKAQKERLRRLRLPGRSPGWVLFAAGLLTMVADVYLSLSDAANWVRLVTFALIIGAYIAAHVYLVSRHQPTSLSESEMGQSSLFTSYIIPGLFLMIGAFVILSTISETQPAVVDDQIPRRVIVYGLAFMIGGPILELTTTRRYSPQQIDEADVLYVQGALSDKPPTNTFRIDSIKFRYKLSMDLLKLWQDRSLEDDSTYGIYYVDMPYHRVILSVCVLPSLDDG